MLFDECEICSNKQQRPSGLKEDFIDPFCEVREEDGRPRTRRSKEGYSGKVDFRAARGLRLRSNED